MEASEALSSRPAAAPEETDCPRCQGPLAALPATSIHSLGFKLVRRCLRCGSRRTMGHAPCWVYTCTGCGLPFTGNELLDREEQRCEECRSSEEFIADPVPALVQATEVEIRSALRDLWRFVRGPGLDTYLNQILREVAPHIPGAPRHGNVVVCDEWTVRCLALPSGTIVLSLGLLATLNDEAELVFVLGHELAHAAGGDAAVRLLRLGFHGIVRDTEAAGGLTWAWAAEDLTRIGYGRERELAADDLALRAMCAMHYDVSSVERLLNRLEQRMEQGDPALAELAVSHPTPRERARRLDLSVRWRRRDLAEARVNREVFRRAAGHDVLKAELDAVEFPVEAPVDLPEVSRGRSLSWPWIGLGAAAALIASVAALWLI